MLQGFIQWHNGIIFSLFFCLLFPKCIFSHCWVLNYFQIIIHTVSSLLSWTGCTFFRCSLRLCFFPCPSLCTYETETCLPLSPCCAAPLQLCTVTFILAVPRSQVWLFWISLQTMSLSTITTHLLNTSREQQRTHGGTSSVLDKKENLSVE